SARAEQVRAGLEQVAEAKLAIAVLVEHAREQAALAAAAEVLQLSPEHAAEAAGIEILVARAVAEHRQDDRREHREQLRRALSAESGRATEVLRGAVAALAEYMAED